MKPTSLLGDVRGFARDFSLDALPRGYVWDLVDYIPRRRGARLDGRGAWEFWTPDSLGGPPQGGYHATFKAGRNLIVNAGGLLWNVTTKGGAAVSVGTGFGAMRMNGVMLRDRVYFASNSGFNKAKVITRTGVVLTVADLPASSPSASLVAIYKDRLLLAGDQAEPQRLYFSPLEIDGGPTGFPETEGGPARTWDALSYRDSSQAITAIYPMASQILVFHDGGIERIRGGIPPGANIESDMYLDPLTDQVGCSDPASVVGWQENVIWAAPRGVYLSDGSTMRSLTEQGGIADFWRTLYQNKRPGSRINCAIFLDLLFVSVLTDWTGSTPLDLRPFTLVCNLNERVWYRFANTGMTCAIPSSADGEEVWWGVDGVNYGPAHQNRLATISSMLFIDKDLTAMQRGVQATPFAVPTDQIDGNGEPVRPQVETGWIRLGSEGVKRLRHIYVSHTTEAAVPVPGVNRLRVSYRNRPNPYVPYIPVGDLPGHDSYQRNRLRLGKWGYGITVKVEQITPTFLSRLHDIAVDEWAQDRGKL